MKSRSKPIPRTAFPAALLLSVLMPIQHANAQLSFTVQPQDGANNVPVNSTLVFTFNQPMDTTTLAILPPNIGFNGSLAFSSNVPGTPQASWNNDSTVLTISFTSNLPGGAQISWTINPDNNISGLVLSSENADIVPKTTGLFTTEAGSTCDPDGIPDTYGSISLFKSATYQQTSTATPTLKNDELPAFYAGVRSPQANSVTSATLTGPGSTDIPLTGFSGTFFASDQKTTQTELDTSYPAGTYSFSLNRSTGGPTELSMQMPSSTSYPNIPQVTNYQLAQSIDPTKDFTLSFNGLQSPAANDVILLDIADSQGTTILSAPDLCIPLPLANTANSFVIPANTLSAGKTYTLRLSYGKTFYVSTTNPTDFASFGALQRQTVLTITTTGGVVVPQPQISSSSFQGGFFAVTIGNLTPGTDYRLQYSTTLDANSWTDLDTINSTTPMPYFDTASNESTGQRFYRIVTP